MSVASDLGPQLADGAPVGMETLHEIEQFLYREAGTLDQRDFGGWFQLFARDIHYWVPVRTNRLPRERAQEFEGLHGAALFDEDWEHLGVRIRKLETDRSWSEVPPSRTRHLVTNVRAAEGPADGEYIVEANVLVYRSRADDYEDLFSGRRTDLLRRVDEGFLIARRHVFLDHSVVLANNLTVFF